MNSSPGLQCNRTPTWFVIVPEGMNSAASLPRISAVSFCSRSQVGSTSITSSFTSALAIAARISGEGRVTVSERRSMSMGVRRREGNRSRRPAASLICLELGNQKVVDRAILLILVIWIGENAFDARRFQPLLQLNALNGGVRGIRLFATNHRRRFLARKVEIDGRIVLGYQFNRRILFDPRQHLLAIFQEQLEFLQPRSARAGEAEGVSAVLGVGDPLPKLFGIERGLGADDGGGSQA